MRCRSCGAEVSPELSICPECGATLRRPRLLGKFVHCRVCQARVPSELKICPYCGATLRPGWRVPLALIMFVLLLVAGYLLINYLPWAEVRAVAGRVRLPPMALLATPTFTATASPTCTATSSPTPTATFTRTPIPPTATPTALPPTATRRPSPTFTPTPRFAAPRLLLPEDQAEFYGSGSQIKLSWEPVGVLAEDEWYALSVRFQAGGTVQYSGTWTKETSWVVPSDVYNRAGQSERAFQWDVTVMKQTGTKPDGGRQGVPLGPTSETRTFFWY